MKTTRLFALVFTMTLLFLFVSCDDSIEKPQTQENILPERFTVDIPESLTSDQLSSGRVANGRVADDHLDGNNIYETLGFFIHLAKESSKIVEAILNGVSEIGIHGIIFISYESDEDGRVKNLEVVENSTYEGVTYEYELTVTDADSEGNDDGGKALQVFWNRDPVVGVAIIKPFNFDRIKDINAGDAVYKVEYKEVSDLEYDAHMIVSISGIPLKNPLDDPYSVDNLKMFVGKTGDIVDIYGNSNHPNAVFFNEDAVGFNWAFVASGNDVEDIGVAEVGLPPSNLDETDREILLVDHSIKQVFTNQILSVWPDLSQDLIDIYLADTEAPGFFNDGGFIQGGTSPGIEYDPLVARIGEWTPYNAKTISELVVQFK